VLNGGVKIREGELLKLVDYTEKNDEAKN